MPADAPFEVTYLNARLPVAGEDELQQVCLPGWGRGSERGLAAAAGSATVRSRKAGRPAGHWLAIPLSLKLPTNCSPAMQMLAVLERKERILLAEINILEYQEANRELIAVGGLVGGGAWEECLLHQEVYRKCSGLDCTCGWEEAEERWPVSTPWGTAALACALHPCSLLSSSTHPSPTSFFHLRLCCRRGH